MSSPVWTPPKEDEVVEPISETKTPTWEPPETDIVQDEWTPPREDDPDDPINIKEPWKISQLKESGQHVSDEQERILFDYEDEKPLTQKAGDFIGGAIKGAPGAFADIAVGGAQLGYKGVLLPLNEMFLGFAMYTPEQRAKITRDRDLTYKALASGGAQGLDEAMEAGVRLAMLGSSVTDKLQGMPKEERFRRYMTRESMRKISQAARDETPDTLARLTAESPLIRGIVKTMVDMQGGDAKAQEEAVQEYDRLVRESGMTKEELDEFAKVVNFGDISMPTALPGANTLTKAVSKPIVTATQKGGELALKGLNLGSRATGYLAGKTIGAGEFIQRKARDIGEYAVNDPDTFLKGAVNTAMLPVMMVAKPTKKVADVITDITRQVDVGGAAGRRGMFERAGRDVRSGATTQKLFGPEGRGGVGRAKLADWAVRQSNAMIQPGVNAGALNVLMGLPDAETAEQAGQQFGTGFGIGAYSGSRAESRVFGMVDPRTTMAQKVTNLVTPDPTQLRKDQDADIKRFMATASPELRQQMQDLSSIDKRKAALDQAIAETTDVQSRTIDKETSDFLQIQIDGYNKQKSELEKATPETQREYDRLIQLTTLDALDQAQAVGTAAGLRGMNLVFLDPANAESFYRNLYGQTLIDAEKNKAILTGRALTPDEQNTLREANETLAAFSQRVDNAQNTRGFAIAEPVTNANDQDYVPPHLRMQNQQGATAVISMDLVKHLTGRGFNVRHAIQHEVQHALENFKEVQDLLSPVRKYLFDQKVQNDDGTFTVVSEGVYNDQKLDEYSMQYAQKFSPADGGAGFFAQFGGDIQKQRDYIKREILAEVATAGGEYQGGSRAALDDVGRNFVDWLEVTTRDGFLKKMKEGLRKVGVVVDNSGGYTTLFDAKITPEVLATIRQYQRGVRDMNSALTYNSKREVEEPDIPLVKILGNRALQEKYKNADFFEKEQIVRATQPDGTQTEIKIPEGANLDSFTGIYRVENGQLVDQDGTPMQLAPEINVQAMPNGTKFEVDTRIARKPDGSPIIIQNREMKRRAIDRTKMLVNAIESAPKDDSPFRMIDVGNGDYRGAMSPSQVEALMKIPNSVLSPNLKRMIQFMNEILRRGDGTRVNMEYQAALLNGKYKSIAPRLRDEVPIGFKITKDGNFTVTTMSVSRMYDKMNAWVAKKPMRLQAWAGDTGKFWDSVMKVLENHAKGEKGETGLHPDPYIALRMKNVVNDLFNVYNAETKAANPERTTLPREKGKDPVDVVVRSRRLDRINSFSENSAQKLPMNYGKLLENYLPANNPLARPQSPDEMMMNLDGSVTATRIRQAIASGNVEQLESELRMSDDLLPFESLYVSQGETGEPQIQVVSMLEPGIEPSLEPSEIPRDIDAETEAEIARLDAEQDMVEKGQTDQMDQQGQPEQQQGQQVPMARAEFIPPAKDNLSQTALDERKAKLPKYEAIERIKDIREYDDGYDEIDGFVELNDPNNNKQIGRADYSIFGREDSKFGRSLVVGFSFVNDKYLGKGYGEGLYRELAKIAQKYGATNIEGQTSPEARKVRNKLFQEQTQNWQDEEGKNDMVSLVDSGISYLPAEDPFYSRLQRGIQESQQAIYSPDQAKALARKSTNAEELKWSGIENAIDSIAEENSGKVPKQALLDYMANEGQVKFEEVILAETTPESYDLVKKEKELDALLIKEDLTDEEKQRIRELKFALRQTPIPEKPKYGPSGMNKVLPGGQNYREVVLKMPEGNRGKWNDFDAWLKGRVGSKRAKVLTEKERNDFKKEWRDLNPAENDYTSSHYSNIPNYVAHIRLNERKDAEGKEGLFIEEIQSDRHQQGRKKGYRDTMQMVKSPFSENMVPATPDEAAKIPDAPFRQSRDWGLTMFKRALRDAVASGKEWIGWTDGATQADRYDLSQQVDEIDVNPMFGYPEGYRIISIKMKNNSYNIGISTKGDVVSGWGNAGDTFEGKNISDVVGKEMAEKIINGEMMAVYSGNDLKIGGEGMIGFYDKILPTEIGKYVGKMGGKVKKSNLTTTGATPGSGEVLFMVQGVSITDPFSDIQYGDTIQGDVVKYWTDQGVPKETVERAIAIITDAPNPIWRVDITPEIAAVVSKGQPQYLPAGKIGKKVSDEYGLEEGQEAETRLTPRTLYNLYYIATEQEPTSEYGREIQNEYIDKYKRLYVDVFSNLVRQQIEKYIKRGRVDSNVTQEALDKSDNPSLLDELMRGTYRSDMRKRNDVWNIVTDHLKNLASAKTKKDKIFYMDRLNNSIHNTQELLFSKFNNYGQLQEAFDSISNARDTRAFSQRVDKDLREAGSFTADTQYLPYVPYSLPRDPRKIMADFYLLTTTGDKAGYFGQNWEKIKGMQMPTRVGLRYEEYGENLEEAVGKLTEQMKRHMSDSLLFSISAELRHALERSQPDELMNNPFMKAYREYYESYEKLKNVNLTPLIEKNLQGIYPEGKRARITKGSPKEYQASNKAVRKALEETGISLQDFSEIAENIFRKGRWATSYGGQPWGNIAEGLRMIANAETTEDMVKAMDNAYDLQHNTATVFNKIKKYQREGGYKWLQDMLDFKYHAMTPRELVPLASSAAKRIAAPALLDIGDPALDKSRENAVAASSEELVSGLESAIGRLKGNQENVYNDIWVKAQKGSGKDINEELFKWLRAQMPARKDELEAVGVNNDIIRYARLLLAEKMAPIMEVPSDIKEIVANSIKEQKQKENSALTFLSPEDKKAMMSIALNNTPDSDPQYQKVMRGIYENYTSEQVKSIFDWYLKYKYKVGGLLAKPLENIPAPYTAKAEKASLAELDFSGIFADPLPDTADWMLPNEEEHVIKEATKSAEFGVAPVNFFGSLVIGGKKAMSFLSDKQTKDLLVWYVDLLSKYEAEKKKSAPKSEIAQQPKLNWQDIIPNSDDAYADYPNGDKPSGATVNVWVDGSPKKAFIVVHHDGTSIIIDNIRYAVPWGSLDESVAGSKKGLIDQITGKYNDIVSDLKEYEDVDLSFVDPAKTKSESAAKQEKTKSEPSPKFPIKKFNDSTITAFKDSLYDTENEKVTIDDFFKLLSQYEASGNLNSQEGTDLEYWAKSYMFWMQNKTASQIADDKYSHISKPNQKQTETLEESEEEYGPPTSFPPVAAKEKTPDIEGSWPQTLSFMSPYEIDYVKQSIKDAIAAGNNSNTWLNKFEMYGQKAENAYSPDSQKELKKLFDAEAKKLQKSQNPRLSTKKAEGYFNKSITDYANSYWKEVIDQNKNYADEIGVLVESLLAQHSDKPEFSAKRKTVSIGRRTYTAYTPVKGGDVYILYGTPNKSGEDLNYKWDGAATFTTKNKTKDDVLDDLEWWFKGEVDYYDPQI